MADISSTTVPEQSLLAQFGGAGDYRDCFVRDVAGTVSLAEFIERFYCSAAFRPERLVLGLMGRGESNADARAVARGEADRFAVWRVVERRETEALLEARETGTASWFAVEPLGNGTRLCFGSWVGNLEQSGWKALLRLHVWYSRFLLGAVRF
ncbi:hypothetical protein [Erythrobacter sp. JK5]|uniref:hypothetical protein n=1 Tax=Erythrobacter sp. JK5 TaxID=2829500 RepID=UPI001BA6BE78|nr:hypothetical protein [Erythrobacter sp. JK5]QUL37018.1 hypothetical protein KDC96_11515 [Erythrobacter sp. JK5]